MASMVAENWDHMNGHDSSENFELSPRNHNLLMSLLDESQVDDCDDERLKNVIRSLEAEIDFSGNYTLDNTLWESDLMDCQSSIEESYSQNPPTTYDDLDLHWMDIEIIPTSPSGDMGCVSDWAKNYTSLEVEQDYGSLWHETNATTIE